MIQSVNRSRTTVIMFLALYTSIVSLLDHVSKLYHDTNLFLQENGIERSCLCEIRQAHNLLNFCNSIDLIKSTEISKSLDPISMETHLAGKPLVTHDDEFKFLASVLKLSFLQLEDVNCHFLKYVESFGKIISRLDDASLETQWNVFSEEVPGKITFLRYYTVEVMKYLQIPLPETRPKNVLTGHVFTMNCAKKNKIVKINFNSEAKMSHLTQKKLEYVVESLKYSHAPGLRLLKR